MEIKTSVSVNLLLSKLSSFPVLLKVHSDLNSFKRLWRDRLVNYRPLPNNKFHTHEKIALSFLPPPRGSQGGPAGERSWADSHSPYKGTAKLPPKYQPQDWGIKNLFCEKFGGICTWYQRTFICLLTNYLLWKLKNINLKYKKLLLTIN